MSMKSTGESQISTDKSQVAVYFNDISQNQLRSTAKEPNFTKESSWRGRFHVHVKRTVRPVYATVLQHKKPTSSAADDITGGSRLTSQTVLRQEVPTATSKSYTFKTSMVI
uniref:Uncharacterized protein n=1 Tax=Brassica campestris TaxID=3711 RepID=M4FFL7_BRACM